MTKTSPITLILLILFMGSVLVNGQQVFRKVVEVEPVALDVILSVYDKVVVLFTNGIDAQNTKLYEDSIQNIIKQNKDELLFNKTLFAMCDLSKDHSGRLKKFGGKQSIQLITGITHYQLKFPTQKNESYSYFTEQFPKFIRSYFQSKAQSVNFNEIKQNPKFNEGYVLLVSPSKQEQVTQANKIYEKVFDYLNFFNISFVINKEMSSNLKVDIYKNGQKELEYPTSAIGPLFNFTKQPLKQQINDLVDFINIQTIGDVSILNDQNYFRVFGSSIQYQLLLIYRQKDQQNQKLKNILSQFKLAASRNRNQGLKYERVLFAVGTQQFLTQYFADKVLQNIDDLYSIIMTKTDYSSFQLRKFEYTSQQITSQKLLQFIYDVKMKRIDAKYKSEEIQDNSNRKIRKIVGKNFEKQVFEQPEKSVMVLFIDSKDQNSSKHLREALNQFVDKNFEAYKDKLHVAIFDLAKNENKMLTISTAPELVLFQRTNKKKPKFFKGDPSKQSIKNFINYQVKDITIPQNFGEPPIALGSPSNTEL